MSELLEEIYAGSGGIALVEVVEFHCSLWESVYLVSGFRDVVAYVPELGEYRTFQAASVRAGKATRDNRGNQVVPIVIDNVWAETTKRIVAAVEGRAGIEVRTRSYLSNDLSRPVSNTLIADVKSAEDDGTKMNIHAGFFSVYNTNFNRITYNADTAPCIKYSA